MNQATGGLDGSYRQGVEALRPERDQTGLKQHFDTAKVTRRVLTLSLSRMLG